MNQNHSARVAPTSVERVRVPKTAEVVARTLRNQIVQRVIPEGEPLPTEAELMQQFGISRPSLREAFRILESEQLIVVRRGAHGGARATRPSLAVAARYLAVLMQYDDVELRDVFQARALLEPLALQLLAKNPNRKAIGDKLTEALERATEIEGISLDERASRWIELILTMFESAGNKTMYILYSTLTEVVRQELISAFDSTPQAAQNTRKAVLKAFELACSGRGEEASEFWRQQISLISDDLMERFDDRTLIDISVHPT